MRQARVVIYVVASLYLGSGTAPHEANKFCCLSACRVIAETGVQFISCGALTHSVLALDISLNIQTQ